MPPSFTLAHQRDRAEHTAQITLVYCKLLEAELADVRAQWQSDRETAANLDSCEGGEVVNPILMNERLQWLMAEVAKATGLFDAPMIERVLEFFLRHHEICEGKGQDAA